MSPLRRVRVLCSTIISDERGVTTVATDAVGDHVLLTVEEYRERIRDAHQSGWNDRDLRRATVEWEDWEGGPAKRRLDKEVGP